MQICFYLKISYGYVIKMQCVLTINKNEISVVFENCNKMMWVHTNYVYTCTISKTEHRPILGLFYGV